MRRAVVASIEVEACLVGPLIHQLDPNVLIDKTTLMNGSSQGEAILIATSYLAQPIATDCSPALSVASQFNGFGCY